MMRSREWAFPLVALLVAAGVLTGCGSANAANLGIKISRGSGGWTTADDGMPVPEVTFTVTNTSSQSNDNLYIEVHFVNPKTNEDYGYENDDLSLASGSSHQENMELNQGISGISSMFGSISTVNAVVDTTNNSNQLVTLATIPIPAPSTSP